jgi:hypothetical protein
MVIQTVTVNSTYWDTQTSSIWSYTVPKMIKVGNSLYNISFKTNSSLKRK